MPYTYKKEKGKYVVYKKSGEKVGTTGGTRKELNKYLAALHIHEPKKEMKKENAGAMCEPMYVVRKPMDGIAQDKMVMPLDPLQGLAPLNLMQNDVHSVVPNEKEAQRIAAEAYEGYKKQMEALEKKKALVMEKIKSKIDELEKMRSESVKMIQENPKDADPHKQKVAHIATQIDDLVDKLKRIEISKKPLENDSEKKKETKKHDKKEDKKKVEEMLIKALKAS